ncbi:MAG: hypothetical protein MJK13_01550 [Pseudomonadales bacterium]|nr:hypothetical protein [Pseudomonadales bacterium]
MKKLLVVAMAALLSAPVVASTEVVALIDKAQSTRLQAAAAGFEWTKTAGLIKSAQKALKDGDAALAQKLASKALKQAENSLLQAQYSDEHWQDHAPQ